MTNILNDAAREALTAGNLAHLVTLHRDGSPHVSIVWVGVEGDEIVSGHLGAYQKVKNVGRESARGATKGNAYDWSAPSTASSRCRN